MAAGDERSDEVEVKRGNLGNARSRDEVALALDDEEGLDEEKVRARQAAIGERRRYAGPVFEDVPTPAAEGPDLVVEVVEATVLDLTWAEAESPGSPPSERRRWTGDELREPETPEDDTEGEEDER